MVRLARPQSFQIGGDHRGAQRPLWAGPNFVDGLTTLLAPHAVRMQPD